MLVSLPWLNCPNIIFTVKNVEYNNEGDYYWYGTINSNEEEDIPCTDGSITLMAKDGEKFGTLILDGESYEFFELGEGLQVFTRFKTELLNENECGNAIQNNLPNDTLAYEPRNSNVNRVTQCQGNSEVKVLVLWTDAAEMAEGNINNRIALAINQTNQCFYNSIVYQSGIKLVLAGSQRIAFNETQNTLTDINNLASSTNVQALRNAFQADIVILLTNGNYGETFGRVHKIGPIFASAYGIVQTNSATGGRFTFAHEIGHLFGARHDAGADPTPGFAHGMGFTTGFIFTKLRYTLLCTMPAGKSREQNYSNPDVRIKNKPTGSYGSNDNARQLRLTGFTVANFYPNQVPGFNVGIINDFATACFTGSAEADVQCGTAPFIYLWESNYNGFGGWQTVGNTEIVNFNVDCYDWAVLYLKLTVTDANGQSTTITKPYTISHHQRMNINKMGSLPVEKLVTTARIYPNPAAKFIRIDMNLITNENVKVSIIGLTGSLQKVLFYGLTPKGSKHIDLNTSEMPNGFYFIKIETSKNTEIHRVTILK